MAKMTEGEKKFMDFNHGRSGSFYDALFKAILKASADNLNKLSSGFPEEVRAFTKWSSVPGYAQDLEDRYQDGR